MNKKRWAIGALVAGLVLLGLAPRLVPGAYWSKALVAAAAKAGQDLTLTEPTRLRLFPSPQLSTGPFAVSDGGDPWLQGESLDVRIEAGPLLGGRVEVAHLELIRPVVRIHELPEAAEGPAGEEAEPGGAPPALQDVRVRDGSVFDGDDTLVEAANLDLSWPGPGQPVEVSGDAVVDGQSMALDGWIEEPLRFAGGGDSKLDLQLKLPGGDARLNGKATLGKAGTLDGTLDLGAADLRGLLGWMGIDLGEGDGFRDAAIRGRVGRRGDTWSLTGIEFALDKQPLRGDIELKLSKPPRILATMTGEAELDRWLGPGPPMQPSANAKKRNPKARRRAKDSASSAGEDGGWSTTPLDFSLLTKAQGRIELRLARGQWGAFPLGGTLVATLKAGRLQATLDLDQPNLPGKPAGRIEATLRHGQVPSIATTGRISSQDLGIQLAQLVGVERLTGAGSLQWDLSARGTTTAELVRAASGTGSLRMRDGGLKELDLLELLTSFLPARDSEAFKSATTPFKDARISWALDAGRLQIDDLLLDTEPARLTGGGAVDLMGRAVGLDLTARLGLAGRRGVRVPLAVQGDFSGLTWTPDASKLLGSGFGGLKGALGTPGFRPR